MHILKKLNEKYWQYKSNVRGSCVIKTFFCFVVRVFQKMFTWFRKWCVTKRKKILSSLASLQEQELSPKSFLNSVLSYIFHVNDSKVFSQTVKFSFCPLVPLKDIRWSARILAGTKIFFKCYLNPPFIPNPWHEIRKASYQGFFSIWSNSAFLYLDKTLSLFGFTLISPKIFWFCS